VVRQLDPPRTRRSRGGLALAAIAVILLLALLGLVSSGIFIADKLTAGSHPAKPHRPATGSSLAVAELARAHAQATAIVKAANDAGTSIVRGATVRAHRQAAAIIAAAQKRANKLAVQPSPVPAPAVAPTTEVQQSTVPPSTSSGLTAPGVTAPGVTTAPGSAAATPNLSSLPASWLVVGYNATFGSGPGSAGSISVLNRSGKVFSGVATVKYEHGGSASAFFSGLAPGQSLSLPLNGAQYGGGGYRILVNVH
jgi:hypothetical protein